jgi:hypothetical protein
MLHSVQRKCIFLVRCANLLSQLDVTLRPPMYSHDRRRIIARHVYSFSTRRIYAISNKTIMKGLLSRQNQKQDLMTGQKNVRVGKNLTKQLSNVVLLHALQSKKTDMQF